jgi:hypothetical protein
MDQNQDEMRQYLEDLKEMRDLVQRHEERPIVEYWDFISWGILMILGTLLHARFFAASIDQALLVIWLPIIIIGGVIETLAWFYLVNRIGTPITARRNQRFYLAAFLIMIATLFVLYYLIHLKGPIPGMSMLLVSILFAFVAQMSYMALFLETALTLIAGIVLTMLNVRGMPAAVGTGIYLGLTFIAIGIHTRILEKRHG